MDKNKIVDLIKSYVLGCLGSGNEASIKSLMEDAENFPWRELGQYQNLVAIIPINLHVEAPRAELKEKVSRMLYELKEAAEGSHQSTEISFDEPLSVSGEIQLEETTFEESLPVIEEQEFITEEPVQEFTEEITSTENYSDFSDKTEIQPDDNLSVQEVHSTKKRQTEVPEKKTSIADDHKRGSKMKDIIDREDFEKRTKEYINAYYQKKFEDLQEETKKALYIAIAGLSLAFIAAILAIL